MLHNITTTAEDLALIQKRKYAVLKTDMNRVEGDGIIFTVEGTRTQLQAVITDVCNVFTSKQVLALEGLMVTGADDLADTNVGSGPGSLLDESQLRDIAKL